MIELIQVRKTFGNQEILKGISATFLPGKVNMIIGASGSGKSVLMKTMVGLIVPTSGEVLLSGQNFQLLDEDGRKEIREKIGMLFQGSALFSSMTVEENVILPLKMFSKSSKSEMLDRVNFVLDRVGLTGNNRKFPSEISGGMQKRVGIARAIVLNPSFLFCDEPNSGLDPLTSIKIDELIQEITQEYNITTVVNTHDMNSVMEIGDHILFAHQGEKCWEGNKSDILHSDNKTLNQFVFATQFLQEFKETRGKRI
jgi:phospholipid/cholesterol/gamma-HCH transport system ATP-binding protein